MYTLERVLYLVDDGSDIYCKIYKSDRYVAEGWLTDMDLDSDTKIESYRLLRRRVPGASSCVERREIL